MNNRINALKDAMKAKSQRGLDLIEGPGDWSSKAATVATLESEVKAMAAELKDLEAAHASAMAFPGLAGASVDQSVGRSYGDETVSGRGRISPPSLRIDDQSMKALCVELGSVSLTVSG